jgi:hypothetical protein
MKEPQAIPKKKPREVRVPRRQGGGTFVLRMSDYHEGQIPGVMGLWPAQEARTKLHESLEPLPISGLCPLPARFTLSGPGIGSEVLLVLDRVPLNKKATRSELAWVSVTYQGKRREPTPNESKVRGYEPRQAVTEVSRIPLETLLREAVKLCGVVGFWYPPGYEGPVRANREGTINLGGTTVHSVGARGEAYPVAWADSTDPVVRQLSKREKPPRVNSDSHETLRLVAKTYKAAESGQRHERVREALEAVGLLYGPDNVKRLISKCRKFGLIPPTTKRGRQ